MQVTEAVELYRFAILHLSEQSQHWYATRLKPFAAWCSEQKIELEQLKTTHVRQYIGYLQSRISKQSGKRLSSYTVHGHARGVRAFLNWCAREDDLAGKVSENVARRIGMPHLEEKVVETFTDEQIKALFIACDQEYLPKLQWRARAILMMLLDTGIRADELCSLTLENCTLLPEMSFIRVHGKGDKWREIGLGKKARAVIHRYVSLYRAGAKKSQPVFVSRFNKPLTINALETLTRRLGRWAHLDGVHCHPHAFRHTFACRYLLQGGDVYVLSLLMGHTSIAVTQRYLRAIKAQQARRMSKSVMDNL
jgi:site-specific recombinase XerD